MPEGRMLKKVICASDKINDLSWPSMTLFTWGVMFEDSAGYIEAGGGWIKKNILPGKYELTIEEAKALTVEIIKKGAWIPFRETDNGKLWVWDPKFEDSQKRRRKETEAESKFATRVMRPNKSGTLIPCEIEKLHIGLEPISVEEIEKAWEVSNYIEIIKGIYEKAIKALLEESSLHSGGSPGQAVVEPESPLSSPPKKLLKEAYDKDPELYEIATTLKNDKWPDVGGFIGKALKDSPTLRNDLASLKQTLCIVIEKKSFDEKKGGIFAFAKGTLESVVKENVTKRVERQAKEFKEDEKKGPEQVGKILEGLNK